MQSIPADVGGPLIILAVVVFLGLLIFVARITGKSNEKEEGRVLAIDDQLATLRRASYAVGFAAIASLALHARFWFFWFTVGRAFVAIAAVWFLIAWGPARNTNAWWHKNRWNFSGISTLIVVGVLFNFWALNALTNWDFMIQRTALGPNSWNEEKVFMDTWLVPGSGYWTDHMLISYVLINIASLFFPVFFFISNSRYHEAWELNHVEEQAKAVLEPDPLGIADELRRLKNARKSH